MEKALYIFNKELYNFEIMISTKMPWDLRQITKYSSVTSENRALFAEVVNLDNKKENRVDMHFELELGIVLNGSLKRDYDGTSFILEPGEVWFTNIWEPHGYTLHESPCSILLILIHPQMLQDINIGRDLDIHWNAPFVSDAENRPGKLSNEIREKVLAVSNNIINILGKDNGRKFDKLKQLQLRLSLLRILTHIHSCWCEQDHSTIYLSAYKLINPAIEALFSGREFISTDDAANRCGLSSSAFNKKFKELMGSSFSQYALSYRLKGAATQLIHSDDPLKKVVSDWGFTDESHLHRCFTKQFGITPGKYRQQKGFN